MGKTGKAGRTRKRQIEREIDEALRPSGAGGAGGGEGLFWPGGHGGGGSRRRVSGAPVVKPHARTSARCSKCTQYHTTAEHKRHAGRGSSTKKTKSTTAKPTPRKRSGRTGRTARAAATRTPVDPVAIVRQAARDMPVEGRFGDRKVFISEIWRRTRGQLKMTLDEFKQWLIGMHRAERLTLTRADLVSAMDPALVAASETFEPGTTFPTWHFVIDESVA